MTETMREKTFNIRFNDEEWERLDRVSKARGINAASLIRMLLKEADDGDKRKAVNLAASRMENTLTELDLDILRALFERSKTDVLEAMADQGLGESYKSASVLAAAEKLVNLGALKRAKKGFALTAAGRVLV